MGQEIQDPGIGTKFGKTTKRVINPDGSYNVVRKGTRRGLRDVFRYLIEISWWKFFGILFLGYLTMNLVFALLYLVTGVEGIGGIDPEADNYFLHAFFFSVQTFTTVGYGGLAPVSLGAQSIAAIEAFVGFLSFSLATGLLYGRFSRPTSRILFSDNMLYSKYKDGYSFKVKLVNERDSVLMEVEAQMIATFDKIDSNGEINRRYFRLPLEIEKVALLPYTWTLVHHINDDSPFINMSQDEILDSNVEFLILIKAHSEVFGTHIHSRKSYNSKEILWNKGFRKIWNANDDGIIEFDVRDLNDTVDE